jgi:S1-C subfamily serine protease
MVEGVEPGGPAANAGLRSGDRIQTIDGRAVASMRDVNDAVQSRAPGQLLAVRAVRAGKPHVFMVVLGSRPAQSSP